MNLNDFVVLPNKKAASVKLNGRDLQQLQMDTLTLTQQNSLMEEKLRQLRHTMSKEKEQRGLEYKYSLMVMSANKECEIPGADSCAVMKGVTEGDVEDEVVFTKSFLLHKLKAMTSKVR